MLRYLLLVLLAIHGLLHLIGFLSGYRLAKFSQLNTIPSKTASIAWLIATLLFAIALIQYMNKKDYWWMVASMAIILSQTLIILHWKDARFGTILNLLLLIPLFLAFARWKSIISYQKEVSRIYSQNSGQPYTIIRSNMLHHLPVPVRRWLEISNIIGKPITQNAFLHQKGEMKTEPQGKWTPLKRNNLQRLTMRHLYGKRKYKLHHGFLYQELTNMKMEGVQ